MFKQLVRGRTESALQPGLGSAAGSGVGRSPALAGKPRPQEGTSLRPVPCPPSLSAQCSWPAGWQADYSAAGNGG